MGAAQGSATGDDDDDEEEGEVFFQLRGRDPPPKPPPPPKEEIVEADQTNGHQPSPDGEASNTAGSADAPEDSDPPTNQASQEQNEPGTEGVRQRKKNAKNTARDQGSDQKQETKVNEPSDNSADSAAKTGSANSVMAQWPKARGTDWSLIIKLILFMGVCLSIGTLMVPMEDSFQQMRDGRYVKPVAVKPVREKNEFEFIDTDGEMIKLKREKHSKSGKFCVNEYVNGTLEEFNLQSFLIDTVKRTYRDSQWTGHFKESEDLDALVKLRDKMFEFLEMSFTDFEGDEIRIKRERSSNKACGHTINLYVGGHLEDIGVKFFNIDVEKRSYSEKLGEGRFRADEDLSKLVSIRDQLFPAVNASNKSGQQTEQSTSWATWFEELMPLDRSFQGHVAWSRYVNHGPFALATIALSVPPTRSDKKRTKSETDTAAATHKLYWHRYLGLFGCWLPLPYFPLPGNKENTFGVGFCVLGHCLCAPDYFAKQAPKSGKSCWKFTGGRAAVRYFLIVPIVIIFVVILKQVVNMWLVYFNCFLSMYNFRYFRFWSAIIAPFTHDRWSTVIPGVIFIVSAIESFSNAIEATDNSFLIFFLLFWGGCWSAFLARVVLYQRLWRGDLFIFWNAPHNGTGGSIAALLAFMARAYSEEPFQFNLYFVSLPFTLYAWQTYVAHAISLAIPLYFQVLQINLRTKPGTYFRDEEVELKSNEAWVPAQVREIDPNDHTLKLQVGSEVSSIKKELVPSTVRKSTKFLEEQRNAVKQLLLGELFAYAGATLCGILTYSMWLPHLAVSS